MPGYPDGQTIPPPELPTYLKDVYDLKPVVGSPCDQELIAIHAVIRVAQRAADIPGMGSTELLSRLSEHLFDVQMAKYRSKYLAAVFPEDTTYNPPALPAHLSVQLEPVSGVPSEEEVIKAQDAIRSYQQLANASSIFDPKVHMELSQHLFDIQMARHLQRAKQNRSVSRPRNTSSSNPTRTVKGTTYLAAEDSEVTNNIQTRVSLGSDQPTQDLQDSGVRDALERSNQLAERSNVLIERSNQIAERANQLTERSNQPVERSNNLVEKVIELLGRWEEHAEQSKHLAELSTKPVEKLEEVLRNINRVLVGIQHAIVRSHKGNTVRAVDCLVNEKGETPGQSKETHYASFEWLSKKFGSQANCQFPVVIEGALHTLHIDDKWLGIFLRFYGACEAYRQNETSTGLREGHECILQLLQVRLYAVIQSDTWN